MLAGNGVGWMWCAVLRMCECHFRAAVDASTVLTFVKNVEKQTFGVTDAHESNLVRYNEVIARGSGGTNEASNNKTKRVVAHRPRLGKAALLEVGWKKGVCVGRVVESLGEAFSWRPGERCVGFEVRVDLALQEGTWQRHGGCCVFGGKTCG